MRRLIRTASIVVCVFGVGVIAYTGLAGADVSDDALFKPSPATAPGLPGYIVGAICVIVGLGTMAAADKLR